MANFAVASRYAKSIFELAVEKNILTEVHNDFLTVNTTLEESKELNNVLKSPIITGDIKLNILKSIFAANFNPLTILFFGIIIRKGREKDLLDIAKHFHEMFNESKGIVKAKLITAFEPSQELLTQIQQILKSQLASEIELETKTDKTLIAGFKIELKDRLFDASLQKKIQKVRQELTQTQFSKN